jgi:hypothetical protein
MMQWTSNADVRLVECMQVCCWRHLTCAGSMGGFRVVASCFLVSAVAALLLALTAVLARTHQLGQMLRAIMLLVSRHCRC